MSLVKTRKIVITGPESTGKSTLAEFLSGFYQVPMVPEFSREYLSKLDRDYRYADLTEIAKGQLRLVSEIIQQKPKCIIIDTFLLVIKIWSEYRFGKCDLLIQQKLEENMPDLFLLCKPDIPWQMDALRENPEDRDYLYSLYKDSLEDIGAHYFEIQGNSSNRRRMAIEAIQSLLLDRK